MAKNISRGRVKLQTQNYFQFYGKNVICQKYDVKVSFEPIFQGRRRKRYGITPKIRLGSPHYIDLFTLEVDEDREKQQFADEKRNYNIRCYNQQEISSIKVPIRYHNRYCDLCRKNFADDIIHCKGATHKSKIKKSEGQHWIQDIIKYYNVKIKIMDKLQKPKRFQKKSTIKMLKEPIEQLKMENNQQGIINQKNIYQGANKEYKTKKINVNKIKKMIKRSQQNQTKKYQLNKFIEWCLAEKKDVFQTLIPIILKKAKEKKIIDKKDIIELSD